jgi:hypothetical protein
MLQNIWPNFPWVPLLFDGFEMSVLCLSWTTLWKGGSNFIDDNEPTKVRWNLKWSGFFLEAFKGQMLSKNKV